MQRDDNDTKRLFDLYESNSKNFGKVFGILVGVGLFFLLTAIFPYFLNIYEQQGKMVQIERANNLIQAVNSHITKVNQTIKGINKDIRKITESANNTTSRINNEIKAVNALLPKDDILPITENNTEA